MSGAPTPASDANPASPAGAEINRFLYGFGWIVFLLLAGILSYLFYFGGYRWLMADNSSSYSLELVRRKLAASRDARTLLLGNSAAAEGFRASVYNSVPSASRPAINLGVPSAHMFLFEKVLDLALEGGLQPDVVVLVLTPEVMNQRILGDFDFLANDLNVLKVELNAGDVLRLRHHTHSLVRFADYAGRILLRPTLYSGDLRDFVFRPRQRLQDAEFVEGWLNSLTTPESFPETDNAFSVCAVEPLDQLEQLVAKERRLPESTRLGDLDRTLDGYQRRVDGVELLRVDEFEMSRMRKMLGRFASQARHVFLVPAPYYDPDYAQVPRAFRAEFGRALEQLSEAVPGVEVIPYFPPDCGMMMDTVHLNRHGGELFTAYLREQIEAAISTGGRNDGR